ncbi:MAG: hypothetical protein HETSPECPRED_009458 [Heterodermia speciosa]|uniref:Major facilitator superfamily (MFS) profile domain-containing protein n=1 Tax=Heterodermia speciosa TaxID=116794 RepID=A0A8H3EQ50_9LECA|nr:MAG: hypothetical protein HETSPECPRED_009458 [Heterodermia speciosa]
MASRTSETYLSRAASELGIYSVLQSSGDTKLLCLQRFIRLFAYGTTTLILALHLSGLGVSDARIGLFMTLTLLGDVVVSLLLTLVADGLGRRRTLAAGGALMSASGVVFAVATNYWILLAASVLGVISPSGNEIGPFRAIEESTLSQLTSTALRTDIFAWYTLLGNAGVALGTMTCGWFVQSLLAMDWSATKAYRLVFWLYALLGLIKFTLSLLLSERCEPEQVKPHQRSDSTELTDIEAEGLLSDDSEERTHSRPEISKPIPSLPKSIWPTISPASRVVLLKICLLFAVDSLASGLVPLTWITYFFTRKFAISEGTLGSLFFATNICSAISNLVASSIARRIGLVKTMVFTHLPSSIFLSLIPLPSHVGLAVTFLILRSTLQNMDQAPRQAFIAAAVLPSERTATMGIVNIAKTLSQSAGPAITGWLAGMGRFWIAFIVAGVMKASYDLAMLKMFTGYRSREEQAREEEEQRSRMERESDPT